MVDLRIDGFENHSHTFEFWEFDCNRVRMRIRAITEYDGTGRAIEEPLWVESPNWQVLPEHSVGEAMWCMVCSALPPSWRSPGCGGVARRRGVPAALMIVKGTVDSQIGSDPSSVYQAAKSPKAMMVCAAKDSRGTIPRISQQAAAAGFLAALMRYLAWNDFLSTPVPAWADTQHKSVRSSWSDDR